MPTESRVEDAHRPPIAPKTGNEEEALVHGRVVASQSLRRATTADAPLMPTDNYCLVTYVCIGWELH